eukprot:m.899434 g.899434  ORF g.899434 m.899434 type:complete len:105 (+) comp23680_c1_seq4:2037-2351(+)
MALDHDTRHVSQCHQKHVAIADIAGGFGGEETHMSNPSGICSATSLAPLDLTRQTYRNVQNKSREKISVHMSLKVHVSGRPSRKFATCSQDLSLKQDNSAQCLS